MSNIQSVAGGVIIDGKTIAAQTVTGKVVKARGKYYLQLRKKKLEIPLGPLATEREVATFAGKDVNVAVTKPPKSSVIAIGTWPTPEKPEVRFPRRILCYIPAPDVLRRMNPELQRLLLDEMKVR